MGAAQANPQSKDRWSERQDPRRGTWESLTSEEDHIHYQINFTSGGERHSVLDENPFLVHLV